MQRLLEHIAHHADFHQLTGVHDRHLPAGGGDDGHVMRDHDAGHLDGLLHGDDLFEDLSLRDDVQRGGRLVEDEELGAVQQADDDRHALKHTAGHLMRIEPVHPLGHVDHPQELHRPVMDFRLRRPGLVNAVDVLNLCTDAVHGREGVHRLLEDDGNLLPAQPVHLLMGDGDQVLAHEQGRAGHFNGILRQNAQHAHRQRRFAGAGFTDQAQRIPPVDGEARMAHRLHIAGFVEVGDAQVANVEKMLHHFFPPEMCLGLSTWLRPSPSI